MVGNGPKTGIFPSSLLGAVVPSRLPPFIGYDPPAGGIWLIKPDGSDAHQVGPPDGTDPVWSPDATKILYQASGDLYVMNADGSGQRLIMPSAGGGCGGSDMCWFYVDSGFHWSADGKQIVFATHNGTGTGVATANADGSEPYGVGVTGFEGFQVLSPNFSPDGGWIVFDLSSGGTTPTAAGVAAWRRQQGLYVTRADGGGMGEYMTQVTFGGGVDDPSWSSGRGHKVVYGCLHDHAICELFPVPRSHIVYPNGSPARQRILYMNKNQTLLHPTWNATGTKILVTIKETENGQEQIALMSPSGGRPVVTGLLLASGTYPDW